MNILQQSNPDVEGSQAAEHTLHEEELENVSKVKDPNGGRVSRSHVHVIILKPPPSTLVSLSTPVPMVLFQRFERSDFHLLARCWEAINFVI